MACRTGPTAIAKRQVALIHNQPERPGLLRLFNAEADTCTFALPPPPEEARWARKIDTAREAPEDILEAAGEVPLEASYHTTAGQSCAVFIAR